MLLIKSKHYYCLAISIFIVMLRKLNAKYITLIVDQDDDYANIMAMHLNISFMYYKEVYNDLHETTLTRLILPTSSQETLVCSQLSESTFLISLSRNSKNQAMLQDVATNSGIPVIQILSNSSELHQKLLEGDTGIGFNLGNYVAVVNPVPVFHGVIQDIFPSLGITTSVAVLYDNLYDDSYTSWKDPLLALPVSTDFYKMELREKKIKNQISSVTNKHSIVILVAKTENIEKFVMNAVDAMEQRTVNFIVLTKDVTPLRCEFCDSIFLYWIRPFPTGNIQSLRSMREFLAAKELGTELNYFIKGYDELEVDFSMNMMNMAFRYSDILNTTLNEETTFTCEDRQIYNEHQTLRAIFNKDLKLTKYFDFGPFVEVESGTYFQDSQTRIYRIDRLKDFPDVYYNKMIGTWTTTNRLTVLYNSLDVNVRTLNSYRVVTIVQPPFIQYADNSNTTYEGYCIDLFNLIQERLNFTYTLYEIEDGSFGTLDENDNWNGVIGALVSGSADIALAPLSVMAERENDVDFTVPYYDLVGTTILMKRPDVEYSLFKFMKVLEWPVWLCIFAAYIFTSLLLWLFDKFSPFSYTNNKERYEGEAGRRIFNLKESLWFCMTSLTPQGGGEAPKNLSGRLVAASWWLFGFIIIASYTANLAAFLTVSRLEQPITSLDDLAKQYKVEYAPIKGSASETYFKRMAEIEEQFYNIWKEMSLNESMSPRHRAKLAVWDYPVSDKFTNMWRYMQESKLPENMSVAVDRVLNSQNGFAFIGDATEIKYAALTNCKLQQVGTEFSRKPYAIAVQTKHVLKDNISSSILILLNQRRLEALKEKWWNENPDKLSCPETTDESDGISIQNIGGVFIMILAGIILSLITLVFEYFHYKRKAAKVVDTTKIERNGSKEVTQHELVNHIPVY